MDENRPEPSLCRSNTESDLTHGRLHLLLLITQINAASNVSFILPILHLSQIYFPEMIHRIQTRQQNIYI